ncbi:MAG: ribonuclease J [Hyphomicrobiales bacterium]|nr:ribonuclease J [Hyphomicrobiales bacterium]|tara:strand:- start:542 stop:2218 length:1677 start_codon:yes stop_codon:yes gene_type:complete
MVKNNFEIIYSPIGGAGQIGMNLYLYGYRKPNKEINWIMVDCGIGFADEYYPGIDILVPDIDFLQNSNNKLIGIILTHAHEDHYGAISTLINDKIDVPIYCTKFTSELLKEKISEDYSDMVLDLKIVKDNAKFKMGEFDIEFINVAHSIPEPNALHISLGDFNIVHSADWKIDEKPVIDRKTDLKKFGNIGKSGCDVLVCDSTNIFRKEISLTESKVADNLIKAVKPIKGLAIVTTFSSNVSRLKSIIDAGIVNNRKIVISGRSIKRFVKVAKVCGYIGKDIHFHEEKDIAKLAKNKVLIICTGSQGEGNASLSKITSGRNHLISLDKGDVVLFSSKTIPGNENSIGYLKNKIIELGAEIIDDSIQDIHTTGHPSRPELAKLYSLLMPDTIIPMHGELFHLSEHINFAKKNKIKNPIFVKNGEVVRLHPKTPEVIERNEPSFYLRDGDVFISPHDQALKDRRRLQDSGVIFITLILDRNVILYVDPVIELLGIPNSLPEIDNMKRYIELIIDNALDSLPNAKKRDESFMQNYVEKSLRNELYTKWGKKPIIKINLTFV